MVPFVLSTTGAIIRLMMGYNPGGTPNPYLFYSDDHNAGFLLYQSFRLVKGNSFTVGIDYKNWGGHAWQDSINDNQNELVNKTVNEVAGIRYHAPGSI